MWSLPSWSSVYKRRKTTSKLNIHTYLYRNTRSESGPTVHHSKINTKRERERERRQTDVWVERKIAFNQSAGHLGRWWTQCHPKPTSKESAQPCEFFKRKGEVISVSHGDGYLESGWHGWLSWRWGHHHSPLFAGLLTPCDFPLDAIFFWAGRGVYFMVLCSFLLYSDVNQAHVYTYPLPLGLPSHPAPPSRPLGHHGAPSWAPVLYTSFLLAFYFTRDGVYISILIFQFISPQLPQLKFTLPISTSLSLFLPWK